MPSISTLTVTDANDKFTAGGAWYGAYDFILAGEYSALGGDMWGGFRFPVPDVNTGATVSDCTLTAEVDEVIGDGTELLLAMEDEDDAEAIGSGTTLLAVAYGEWPNPWAGWP